MAISFKSLGASSKVQKTDIIKSTSTWTAPADTTSVELIMCGGGGGSSGHTTSNYYGGTGGGSIFYTSLTVVPSTAYTITIGAGGAKGASDAATGATGGSSSFGALFTATGGIGGNGGLQTNVAGVVYGGAGAGLGGSGGSVRTFSSGFPQLIPAGLGTFGYGAGGVNLNGNSAQNNTTYGSWMILSSAAHPRDTRPTSIAGLANTGDGGGDLSPTTGGGSNGGSGIAIIKYWTAL